MAIPAWFLNASLIIDERNGLLCVLDPGTGREIATDARAPENGLTPEWVMAKAVDFWAGRALQNAGLDVSHAQGIGSAYWAAPSETLSELAKVSGGGYNLVADITENLTDLRMSELLLEEVAAALT